MTPSRKDDGMDGIADVAQWAGSPLAHLFARSRPPDRIRFAVGSAEGQRRSGRDAVKALLVSAKILEVAVITRRRRQWGTTLSGFFSSMHWPPRPMTPPRVDDEHLNMTRMSIKVRHVRAARRRLTAWLLSRTDTFAGSTTRDGGVYSKCVLEDV
jgi:hypothetical protein